MSHPVALGYTRLSQQSDTSIQKQKEEITELANQHDFNLLKIYNDGERASGFTRDRPEYQSLLERIKRDDIDAIIVRDADRIARDTLERARFIGDLELHNVELWTTNTGEPFDYDDNDELLLEILQAHFDNSIKQREIEKSKKQVKQRIENGHYHGRPPKGLQYNEEKTALVPDPDEFEEIIDVLELRDEDYSYRKISQKTGISKSTIGRILDRRDKYEKHR